MPSFVDRGVSYGQRGGTPTVFNLSFLDRSRYFFLVAFSPQANYTRWATATGWRILMPSFVDRGVSCGQRGGTPTVVNLSFQDRSRYFFFQVTPHLCSRDLVDTVPDPLLIRQSVSVGNRTRDLCLQAGTLATRPQRRYHPLDTANENHWRCVESRVQVLLEAAYNNPPWNIKAMWLTEINKFLRNWLYSKWMPQRPCKKVIGSLNSFNNFIRVSHFPTSWKETKVKQTPSHSVRKWTIQTQEKQCRLLRVEGTVLSAQRISTAVNLDFLHRSRFFFRVAPQLTSQGSVDPVPDPLHLR
jgi:hypothetical protein